MTIKLSSPEAVGMCSTRLARIKNEMQVHVDSGDFAGISTLIARKGKVVHFEQVGNRDRENELPMQADTLFRLYSMTKPIVCTAFMMLYEQGKFDLRDPVSKFIPAFANLKVLQTESGGKETLVDLTQPVTMHHLLTHTSGLSYDFYEEFSVCKHYRDSKLHANTQNVSLEDFVNKICEFPLAFQPGAQWYYGVNVDVIARLIEIIADKSLADYLAR
jgi:CubicO group peptidase (beta-lactamase class C family)